MLAAGLLARNAVEHGLNVKPWVKTSLAPGSRAVSEYLTKTGLQPFLDQLGFNVVGFGCTTCIGNSGPLDRQLEDTLIANDLIVASVLSGNRNFEARIHQSVKANFLMSPPLVVAFAIAGRIDIDLTSEPLANVDGRDIYLRDIWPTPQEIDAADWRRRRSCRIPPRLLRRSQIRIRCGTRYQLERGISTTGTRHRLYIREPPYFDASMTVSTRRWLFRRAGAGHLRQLDYDGSHQSRRRDQGDAHRPVTTCETTECPCRTSTATVRVAATTK